MRYLNYFDMSIDQRNGENYFTVILCGLIVDECSPEKVKIHMRH